MTPRQLAPIFVLAAVFAVRASAAQTFTDRSGLLLTEDQFGFSPLGASSIDFDQDGRIDIYQSRHLYRNLFDVGGGFVNMMPETGLDEGDVAFGAIFGDYDNDGFPDVFFMDLQPPSHLFRNEGDGTFVRTDQSMQLDTDDIHIQGSMWLDFDNDGDIDLFVGGDGDPDALFRNVGAGLRFENTGQLGGLAIERGVYGAAASDFDRDGDVDIYVTACRPNDAEASRNMMWVNEDGTFRQVDLGVEDTGDAWGVVWLDYDNDGWMDMYVVNYETRGEDRPGNNLLYRNTGGGFEEMAVQAGVAGGENDFSFSAAAADFDNDGWIDLYLLNQRERPDRLFRNNGDGTFTDILSDTGIRDMDNSAVTVADYDADGYVDIFLGTEAGGALYMNDGGDNHWLEVSLRGVDANRFGIGARVELHRAGELWQVREISAGDGMTSQNHGLMAHFGLGAETLIDEVVVRWPGGSVNRLRRIQADQRLVIQESDFDTSVETPELAPTGVSLSAWPNPSSGDVRIDLAVSNPGRAPLSIDVFDVSGRRVRTLTTGLSLSDERRITWDGRDESGRSLVPGLYLIRATSGDRVATQPVVLTR